MTPTYTVHALRLGTIVTDKCFTVDGWPTGTVIDLPVWAAAVEGGGHRMLIDTGLRDAEKWSARFDPHHIGPGETIDAALAELNWRCEDVDIVINTHLHYDHSENNLRFPHSQFFVSQVQWEYACDPGSVQAELFDSDWTGPELPAASYTLVHDDDHEVLPGLTLIQTPGHTAGHQSVLVETAEGTLCVTGDAACMMENLALPASPATYLDRDVALASIRRICAESDRVFMNHDPELIRYQNANFPLAPAVPGS